MIPGDERFVPTFVDANGVAHAYCDRQTGLVWDAEPVGSDKTVTWNLARDHCINRTVSWNGQKGGRLPSIPELASLVDTTSDSCTMDNICLPDGHPFPTVTSAGYWSASTDADDPSLAWRVFFFDGNVGGLDKGISRHPWCVRGATSESVY